MRLRRERAARAATLLKSADYARLEPDRIRHLGAGVYAVPLGSRQLTLTLVPFDDNLFVSTAVVTP